MLNKTTNAFSTYKLLAISSLPINIIKYQGKGNALFWTNGKIIMKQTRIKKEEERKSIASVARP